MSKIGIIIKREYITRVRNKTFILSTLLTPILIFGVIGLATYFAAGSKEDVRIAIKDDAGLFKGQLKSNKSMAFSFIDSLGYDSLKTAYEKMGFNGVLHVPAIEINKPEGLEYYSTKQLGIVNETLLETKLNDVLEYRRLSKLNIDTSQLNAAKQNRIKLSLKLKDKDGKEKKANSGVAMAVGYASGFLMYILVLLFGNMIMRGVMEEKTNRIAEVMISSVKPFELLMGKIVGIALVGLTGFLMWFVIVIILNTAAAAFLGNGAMQQVSEGVQQMPQQNMDSMQAMRGLSALVGSTNWGMIVLCFIFYFLGGYLFYASLFAAVASTVSDDPQEAQSLSLPISMPIIFSIIIMMNAITQPSGALATWASIIPFSSPIVMMARIPFGVPGTVPWWQLGLSMVSLILGFIATTWMAAKIYRTGILMYGKKVTWKEMFRWAFRKG
jgi:ABC-2 type transport system permease protein